MAPQPTIKDCVCAKRGGIGLIGTLHDPPAWHSYAIISLNRHCENETLMHCKGIDLLQDTQGKVVQI